MYKKKSRKWRGFFRYWGKDEFFVVMRYTDFFQ